MRKVRRRIVPAPTGTLEAENGMITSRRRGGRPVSNTNCSRELWRSLCDGRHSGRDCLMRPAFVALGREIDIR